MLCARLSLILRISVSFEVQYHDCYFISSLLLYSIGSALVVFEGVVIYCKVGITAALLQTSNRYDLDEPGGDDFNVSHRRRRNVWKTA